MSDSEEGTQPAREERPQPSSQSEPGVPARESDRGKRRAKQNQPRPSEQQLPMDELRDLFALFTEHSLTEFELEREGFRIHLGCNPAPQPNVSTEAQAQITGAVTSTSSAISAGVQGAEGAPGASGGAQAESSTAEDESIHIIVSPIVGTFYRAPSPTTEPFVRLGSHVDPDSVVCIIEAMKLMNEIQSETTGEISKIYVENGQPVEYGQPLFGVKK